MYVRASAFKRLSTWLALFVMWLLVCLLRASQIPGVTSCERAHRGLLLRVDRSRRESCESKEARDWPNKCRTAWPKIA